MNRIRQSCWGCCFMLLFPRTNSCSVRTEELHPVTRASSLGKQMCSLRHFAPCWPFICPHFCPLLIVRDRRDTKMAWIWQDWGHCASCPSHQVLGSWVAMGQALPWSYIEQKSPAWRAISGMPTGRLLTPQNYTWGTPIATRNMAHPWPGQWWGFLPPSSAAV